MKKILLTVSACLVIALGSLNASFPVQKEAQTQKVESTNLKSEAQITETTSVNTSDSTPDVEEKAEKLGEKDWILVGLWALGFFVLPLAFHRWYAKKPVGWNILYILTLGGCGVWAVVDLINILTQDF